MRGKRLRRQRGATREPTEMDRFLYETGRKCAAGFKKTMKIVFDALLPKWNYRAVPEPV